MLIGNVADKSQLANALVQTLAYRVGEEYCPEWRFVNVYLNGQFKGLYTFFQKISVEDGTVKIRNLKKLNEELGSAPFDITGGVSS